MVLKWCTNANEVGGFVFLLFYFLLVLRGTVIYGLVFLIHN